MTRKKEYKYRRTVMSEKDKLVSLVGFIVTIILSNSNIFSRCNNRTEKYKISKGRRSLSTICEDSKAHC